MNNNENSDILKCSSFLSENSKNNKRQKYYYLHKVGGKYLLNLKKSNKEKTKAKDIKKLSLEKPFKTDFKSLESHIKHLFHYKYTMLCQYDTNIINRLIYNVSCHISSQFKENLILEDNNEFLLRYYTKGKIVNLLQKILIYYEKNNIIYPNYISLYEGNYIFKNIEQKQKIIDREEKKSKKKKNLKELNTPNKDDKILNSNVIDSILDQTNTSENKKFFGIKDNIIDDGFDEINLLINNIDNIEKKVNENKIFKKKSLIRIVNDINILNKNNNEKNINMNISNNIDKDNKKSFLNELLSTVSTFESLNKSKKFVKNNNNLNINNNTKNNVNIDLFSNTDYNSILKKDNRYNKNHKRINTINIDKFQYKNKLFNSELKDISKSINNKISQINNYSSNNSYSSLKSPYVIKRPINLDNITYSKKIINHNLTDRNNSSLHKNSKSINKYNYKFELDNDYFNIENNIKEIKVYRKKLNSKINNNNDSNFEKSYNSKHRHINSLNTTKVKYNNLSINNIKGCLNIYNQLNIPKRIYLPSTNKNKRENLNLYDYNYKYNKNSPSPNYKIIAKMIKKKYLIEDKIKNKLNKPLLTAGNTMIDFKFKDNKNKEMKNNLNIHVNNNDIHKNYTKNIYISNNITNNNFYSINKKKKKNMRILIYRSNTNQNLDLNKKKSNNNNINQIMNNIKIQKEYSYSKYKENNNNNIFNPYKNGLINTTTLKSLDKHTLNSLLNKFKIDNF